MAEISFNSVVKNFGFKNVLDEFNLEIAKNDRIAIVGKNGAGKTTIFKIIKGMENIESGTVSINKRKSIGFLQQIPPEFPIEFTVKDVLLTSFHSLFKIYDEMKILEEKMSNINSLDIEKTMVQYGNLQEKFMNCGGYEIESNVAKICSAFNINDNMTNQAFSTLSGGQKTIVFFAKLLLEKPDILLLDEPTNHLDIKTLEWLESFLKNYPGTVVINSHDRYFLDNVASKILHLENGKGKIYHGNYSYFIDEQEKELMNEFQDFKSQQKQILAMKDAIKRYRDWGNRSSNEKFFKAAKNLEKRLERMEMIDKPQLSKKILPLTFQQNSRSGKDVLFLDNLSMIYGDKIILDEALFRVNYGEKICLMGDNGCGKSTLLKIILGEIEPYDGKVMLSPSIKVGYLSQNVEFENEEETILDEFRRHFNGSETLMRSTLAKFYFNGENVYKRISKLSGGEKVRLKFAELIQKDVNFLILDEPTNHIDIDTREMLEESLQEFEGTLLFVSHDRYFVNKLAEKVAELKDGKLTMYLGNYDYYTEKKNSDEVIFDKTTKRR